MIKVVACALVLLAPLAASAQEVRGPMQPGLGRTVTAPGGITEAGRGVESLPADRIRLTISTYGGQRVATLAPNAAPTPAAVLSDELERQVLAAMRSNGVADAHVVAPVLGNVSANDVIVGTVPNPTHEKLADIERRIIVALPTEALPALRSTNIGGMLQVDNCETALARARAAAFADAKKRAEALAMLAGVHLGGVIDANENDQTAGCADQDVSQSFFYNGNSTNGANEMNVQVSVYVTATFAIRP